MPLKDREAGRRLLADAKAGKFAVVLVYRVDRLARRLKLLLEAHDQLQGLDVGLKSMTEPIDSTSPIGRFVFQLLGSIAELERETILERTIMGTNRRAAEGRWLGGIVPYGYRVGEAGYLEISDEPIPGLDLSEAGVVRLCYRLLVEERWSTVRIAEHLNALGVLPHYARDGRTVGKRQARTSGKWQPGRIRNMLVEPTYKGIHCYGRRSRKKREVIERQVPAIVSGEVWDAAQLQLAANRIMLSPWNATHPRLLRGLIRCGICGLNYVSAGVSHGTAYYKCNGKIPYRGRVFGVCPSRMIRAADLEADVWREICRYAYDPGDAVRRLRAQLTSGVTDQESIHRQSERLEQALRQTAKEREAVIRLLRTETISYAEGEAHLQELGRQAAMLQSERDDLFEHLQAAVQMETQLLGVATLLEDLRSQVDQADEATRREIIGQLVDHIVVESGGEGAKRRAVGTIHFRFGTVARTGTGSCDRPTLEVAWQGR